MESLVVDRQFWAGKKVFLTGHTGFKGSWLSLWLKSMGAQITGYALPPNTTPALFTQAKIAEKMQSIFGDIGDLAKITTSLQQSQAEIVIHMAAQALVRYSYQNPVETFQTNIMGTVNVLEAVRQTPTVRAVVVVTSDKCYENQEWPWGYRENEPMGGHDPYSNSKGCAELVTASYRNSFFNAKNFAQHRVAIATARAGNVIGGGDWSMDRLVPDILRAITNDEKVIIRSPKAIRPWQHVLEPLSGYLCLAEKLYQHGSEFAEAWNFGPADSDAQEVSWIANKLTKMWGPQAGVQVDASAQALHEAHYLKLDCSKARTRMQWHARWNLETALSKIVDWNRAYLKDAGLAQQITLQQIQEYTATGAEK